MSLLLNALFHHSLLLIPQQEIPGVVPSAYVMQHPTTNEVEVSICNTIHIICIVKLEGKFEFITSGKSFLINKQQGTVVASRASELARNYYNFSEVSAEGTS